MRDGGTGVEAHGVRDLGDVSDQSDLVGYSSSLPLYNPSNVGREGASTTKVNTK